jgi:hypothetical protein
MLSSRLKKYSKATAIVATVATHEAKNAPTVASIATMQVATPAKTESTSTVSNWWLLHFINRDPMQVAVWPPCNYAEVLELNPQAIAAEPRELLTKHIINNASDLLTAMRNSDFIVKVAGGILEVSPAKWIDDDMADLIRKYKHDLIKILEGE